MIPSTPRTWTRNDRTGVTSRVTSMIATTFGAHVAHPQLHSNAPMHSPVSPPAWAVATRVPYRSPPSTRPPHHLLLDHRHRRAPRRAPCRCIRTVRRRQRQPPVQPEPPQQVQLLLEPFFCRVERDGEEDRATHPRGQHRRERLGLGELLHR